MRSKSDLIYDEPFFKLLAAPLGADSGAQGRDGYVAPKEGAERYWAPSAHRISRSYGRGNESPTAHLRCCKEDTE